MYLAGIIIIDNGKAVEPRRYLLIAASRLVGRSFFLLPDHGACCCNCAISDCWCFFAFNRPLVAYEVLMNNNMTDVLSGGSWYKMNMANKRLVGGCLASICPVDVSSIIFYFDGHGAGRNIIISILCNM